MLRAVVDRAGIDPALVEDIYFGAANQAGEDNRNVARMAALLAGFPESVPGTTVNRLCASGLEAINIASRMIERHRNQRISWWESARQEFKAMRNVLPLIFGDMGPPLR